MRFVFGVALMCTGVWCRRSHLSQFLLQEKRGVRDGRCNPSTEADGMLMQNWLELHVANNN